MIQACRNSIYSLWRLDGGLPDQVSHAGLLLSRYLKEFDDDGRAKRELLSKVIKASHKAHDIYCLAFKRWKECTRSATGKNCSVRGRLIVGLGNENVLETGITLHQTYGTPIIPGSALKGLAAHYCSSVWGQNDEFKEFRADGVPDADEKGRSITRQGHYYREMFGSTEDSGHIIFHDAWITPESLEAGDKQGLIPDVMTPHHGAYYMAGGDDNSNAPTDFDKPNPIIFLSVAGIFRICVTCDVEGERGNEWAELAFKLLTEALEHWGVGGKTNAGYGRMVSDVASVSPRFKVGDQVTAKRIEDPKGKGRPWFQTEDGFGGVVPGGDMSQIEMGGTINLWIAAVTAQAYNFRAQALSPRPPQRREFRR